MSIIPNLLFNNIIQKPQIFLLHFCLFVSPPSKYLWFFAKLAHNWLSYVHSFFLNPTVKNTCFLNRFTCLPINFGMYFKAQYTEYAERWQYNEKWLALHNKHSLLGHYWGARSLNNHYMTPLHETSKNTANQDVVSCFLLLKYFPKSKMRICF